jgi:hypothetical protein
MNTDIIPLGFQLGPPTKTFRRRQHHVYWQSAPVAKKRLGGRTHQVDTTFHGVGTGDVKSTPTTSVETAYLYEAVKSEVAIGYSTL